MEEVWGEVDHSMNYPHKVASLARQEQLKVLACVTSSVNRLARSLPRQTAPRRVWQREAADICHDAPTSHHGHDYFLAGARLARNFANGLMS
jgi:hypothetical protein